MARTIHQAIKLTGPEPGVGTTGRIICSPGPDGIQKWVELIGTNEGNPNDEEVTPEDNGFSPLYVDSLTGIVWSWADSQGVWVESPISQISPHGINEHTDVDLEGLVDGQILVYNEENWKPATLQCICNLVDVLTNSTDIELTAGTYNLAVDAEGNVTLSEEVDCGCDLTGVIANEDDDPGAGTYNLTVDGIGNVTLTATVSLFTDVDATGSTRRLTAGTASGEGSTLSGGSGNKASGGSAVIGGGNSNEATTNHSTIAGGSSNRIYGLDPFSTTGGVIVGGVGNVIGNTTNGNSLDSFIGGGYQNTIGESADEQSAAAVIGGGYQNQIKGNSNLSVIGGGGGIPGQTGNPNIITHGPHGTIIGGDNNKINDVQATIQVRGATVLGGVDNLADGDYSVVAGRQAKAGAHPGVFVFADSTTTDFTANAENSAHFGVANGLRVVGPSITLDTNPGVPTVEGHVLTSDVNGVGTWQAPATQAGIEDIPSGNTSGTVTFATAFTSSPKVNISLQGDAADVLLMADITVVSTTGFTYRLSNAAPTGNYKVHWDAQATTQ